MHVELTTDMEELIQGQVETGPYLSPVEVIRDALRLLEERLQTKTVPEPRQVMVAGRLGALRPEDSSFEILLADGTRLQGRTSGIDLAVLRDLLGEQVLVCGLASFLANHRVDRIEAERIERVQGNVSLWEKAPRPLNTMARPDRFRVGQELPRNGDMPWGEWPGDESDEEVFAALEDLS